MILKCVGESKDARPQPACKRFCAKLCFCPFSNPFACATIITTSTLMQNDPGSTFVSNEYWPVDGDSPSVGKLDPACSNYTILLGIGPIGPTRVTRGNVDVS
jgi:hypothetical protein